ncbi:hypothetical protein DXG01_006414 [Tephrocybe rancida]|nr:hypothetical protein DXG01_006414 [Tephrocybe rancida]
MPQYYFCTCEKPVAKPDQERLNETTQKSRQEFSTVPLGPQLQALALQSATFMEYRHMRTHKLQCILGENNGDLGSYGNIISGFKIV